MASHGSPASGSKDKSEGPSEATPMPLAAPPSVTRPEGGAAPPGSAPPPGPVTFLLRDGRSVKISISGNKTLKAIRHILSDHFHLMYPQIQLQHGGVLWGYEKDDVLWADTGIPFGETVLLRLASAPMVTDDSEGPISFALMDGRSATLVVAKSELLGEIRLRVATQFSLDVQTVRFFCTTRAGMQGIPEDDLARWEEAQVPFRAKRSRSSFILYTVALPLPGKAPAAAVALAAPPLYAAPLSVARPEGGCGIADTSCRSASCGSSRG